MSIQDASTSDSNNVQAAAAAAVPPRVMGTTNNSNSSTLHQGAFAQHQNQQQQQQQHQQQQSLLHRQHPNGFHLPQGGGLVAQPSAALLTKTTGVGGVAGGGMDMYGYAGPSTTDTPRWSSLDGSRDIVSDTEPSHRWEPPSGPSGQGNFQGGFNAPPAAPLAGTHAPGAGSVSGSASGPAPGPTNIKDILCCGTIHPTIDDLVRHYQRDHGDLLAAANIPNQGLQQPQQRQQPIATPSANLPPTGSTFRVPQEFAQPHAISNPSANPNRWSAHLQTSSQDHVLIPASGAQRMGLPMGPGANAHHHHLSNGGSSSGALFPAGTGNVDADLSALLASEPGGNDRGSQILHKRNLSMAAFSMGSYSAVELKRFREEFRLSGVDFSDILGAQGDMSGMSPMNVGLMGNRGPRGDDEDEDDGIEFEGGLEGSGSSDTVSHQLDVPPGGHDHGPIRTSPMNVPRPAMPSAISDRPVTDRPLIQRAPSNEKTLVHTPALPAHQHHLHVPPSGGGHTSALSQHLHQNGPGALQQQHQQQQQQHSGHARPMQIPQQAQDMSMMDYLVSNLQASSLQTPPVRATPGNHPGPFTLDGGQQSAGVTHAPSVHRQTSQASPFQLPLQQQQHHRTQPDFASSQGFLQLHVSEDGSPSPVPETPAMDRVFAVPTDQKSQQPHHLQLRQQTPQQQQPQQQQQQQHQPTSQPVPLQLQALQQHLLQVHHQKQLQQQQQQHTQSHQPQQDHHQPIKPKPARPKKEKPVGEDLGPPKPHPCTIPGCLKSYKNPNGLKYHLEHGHPELLPPPSTAFHDPSADPTSSSASSSTLLPAHPTHTNSNDSSGDHKPFICNHSLDCDKPYKNLNGLKYHLIHAHDVSEQACKSLLKRAKATARDNGWIADPKALKQQQKELLQNNAEDGTTGVVVPSTPDMATGSVVYHGGDGPTTPGHGHGQGQQQQQQQQQQQVDVDGMLAHLLSLHGGDGGGVPAQQR
ncbi:Transcriptional regulator of ribosomal biogenesis proteins [Thoreauomyces humboldtii]|nr:Transcriptional regulator of ribosomal biogenesis proteins [Thoreauomyces humboldtii]